MERDPPHEVVAVFAPHFEMGFVYTNGLSVVAASNIELMALDVQRQAVPSFHKCLNFLGSRLEKGHAILPGQKVMGDGDYVNMIVGVDESTNRYLLGKSVHVLMLFTFKTYKEPPFLTAAFVNNISKGNYAVELRADVNLLLVVPIERLPFTLSNGAIVGERELRIEYIKSKFAGRGNQFIRHINGNTLDNNIDNLAFVTAYDALVHVSDWTTNWVCYVTEEEAQFVRDNIDAFIAPYHIIPK